VAFPLDDQQLRPGRRVDWGKLRDRETHIPSERWCTVGVHPDVVHLVVSEEGNGELGNPGTIIVVEVSFLDPEYLRLPCLTVDMSHADLEINRAQTIIWTIVGDAELDGVLLVGVDEPT